MKRFYISILIQLLMLALAITSEAQLFPVQVNTQLTPPYSPYLTDYTSAGSQRLTLQFRLNDVNLSDYNVKLRITIEGVGITIRTKQTFIPQPITLQGGGIPIILYGEDISEYFNPNNLDFAGFTRREYESAGKIPEGVYRFSVEVLDYNRNIVVSNKGTTVAWMILNDPPLLNLPRNDTKIRILDPTNIAFTWTPRHTGSPNSAFSTEYNFKLVEIWPVNRNPYDAFLSQPALYEITTTQSQIIYGLAEPALIPGRKYAWQVQATDTDGRDLFKNHGRSEVYVFQFGDELGVPENFRKETANAATMSVRWEPSTIGEMPDQYRVRYKPVSSDQWLEITSKQNWTTLTHLKSNTAYDVQVRGERQRRFGEYTVSQRMNTAEEKPAGNYSCGTTVNIQRSDTTGFLLELAPGDVFSCADFKVVVAQAKKIPNGFAGTGLMQINMLNGASVEVNFSGSINREYKLTAGSVESTYAKGSAMGRVIEEMDKIGEEKKEEAKPKADSTDVPRPIDIIYPGVIRSVSVNADGKIEVVDEDGTISTHEPKKDETTQEVQETVIADSGGNTYAVGKDGKVTRVEGGGLQSGNSPSPDVVVLNNIKENMLGIILEDFKEEITAWLRINGKGGEDDPDVLLALALPECFPQDADKLKHINESTIPYFENHKSELQQKIEIDQSNKELFDRVGKTFLGKEVVWSEVSEEDQLAIKNAACKVIVESDKESTVVVLAPLDVGTYDPLDPHILKKVQENISPINVNMQNAPAKFMGRKTTVAYGRKWNARWAFYEIDRLYPDFWSEANKAKIRNGILPVVDEKYLQFIGKGLSQADFDKLRSVATLKGSIEHHHMNHGNFAVSLETTVHKGATNTKFWHNPKFKNVASRTIKSMSNITVKSLLIIGFAISVHEVFSGDLSGAVSSMSGLPQVSLVDEVSLDMIQTGLLSDTYEKVKIGLSMLKDERFSVGYWNADELLNYMNGAEINNNFITRTVNEQWAKDFAYLIVKFEGEMVGIVTIPD